MSQKQGFKNDTNGAIFSYQENAAGNAVGLGVNTTGTVSLFSSATPFANISTGQINIDGASFDVSIVPNNNAAVNVTTSGIGDIVLTTAAAGDIFVFSPGTIAEGVAQVTNTGVLFSDAGTDGQVLIGATGAAPAWANITSLDASVAITNGANSIDLSASGSTAGTSRFLAIYTGLGVLLTSGVDMEVGTTKALTEVYDPSGVFFPGDGAGTGALFTAPATGVYHLIFSAELDVSGSFSNSRAFIVTTARNFYNRQGLRQSPAQHIVSITANMTIGDTASFWVTGTPVSPAIGALVGDLNGLAGGSTDPLTWICGYRIA